MPEVVSGFVPSDGACYDSASVRRLGACILVELAVVGGLVLGVTRAGGAALDLLLRDAVGATIAGARLHARPVPEAPPHVPVAQAAPGTFLGMDDDALLSRLREAPIKTVKVNTGGSSLSLKLKLADGSAAAFKPVQIWPQTIPRYEIAAYRINRALGLNAVSPATTRVLTRAEIVARIDPKSRALLPRIFNEARFRADGTLPGEASYWIPTIRDAELEGRPWAEWTRWLTPGERIPDEALHLAPQIASMIAFDFLTNNHDRFSGENTQADERFERLYYMDNTMSFDPAPEGHPKCAHALELVGRWPRSLVRAVEALDGPALVRALAAEPPGALSMPRSGLVLSDDEIRGVLARRERLLAAVRARVEEQGETVVVAFP